MNSQQIWFITGASKGLGLALVKRLLNEGYKVAATSRNINDLTAAVGVSSDQFLPLAVNILDEYSVNDAIEKTIMTFGKIDVLVNNAGYGLIGGLEELTDAESRANFDVNVFGLLNVTRKVLPYMRLRQSGHILNISSIGGFTGAFPGFGIYCATKFAVNGLSESMAEEVKPFGIKVTIVEPGYFRTNFLSEGSLITPKNPIDAYESVRASQNMHQNNLDQQQPGDPEKAAAAMIRVAGDENAPMNLFLGADAYEVAYQKIATVQQDLEAWKDVTVSTGF